MAKVFEAHPQNIAFYITPKYNLLVTESKVDIKKCPISLYWYKRMTNTILIQRSFAMFIPFTGNAKSFNTIFALLNLTRYIAL